jgi:endonuclease YncB( thermonuclease family)
MAKLVLGRKIRCELADEHRQDRCVGVRHLDGQGIATIMVHQGLARDCPRADSFAPGMARVGVRRRGLRAVRAGT